MKVNEVKDELVWDWMRPEKATIQMGASIEEAVSRMEKLSIHHLIVMNGKKYEGILDARDCVGIWNKNAKIESIVCRDVPLIDENTDIKKVVALFTSRKLTAIAYRKANEVHGIITSTDLIRLLENELSKSSETPALLQTFLATPLLQSLARLLGNAGL